MNRKDMQQGVLYAIKADGYNTRPGYVLDPNKPPNKVRVKVYWTWENQDDDYLNPTPPLTNDKAKSDIKMCDTSGVQGLWSDYCATVKAERQAALDKRAAEDAEVEAVRQGHINRVESIATVLEDHGLTDTLRNLRWCAKDTRGLMSQREFSANEVLNLIESLCDTKVST